MSACTACLGTLMDHSCPFPEDCEWCSHCGGTGVEPEDDR